MSAMLGKDVQGCQQCWVRTYRDVSSVDGCQQCWVRTGVSAVLGKDRDQQGRIQDFPKGGVETRDTKSRGGGGGGGLSASGPIRKAGGGALRF